MMKSDMRSYLLLLMLTGMGLRKAGFGAGSFLFVIAMALIALIYFLGFLKNSRNKTKAYVNLLLAAGCAVTLSILEYKISRYIPDILYFTIWIICVIILFSRRKTSFSETFPLPFDRIIFIITSLILFTSAVLNDRQFHNLYRNSTYEEHIRQIYPEHLGRVADVWIEKYKPSSKSAFEKANVLLQSALLNDSLRNSDEALRDYNLSIDLNPDNYFSYYRRGLLKLTQLDINNDVAFDAVKDFDRSIRLKGDYGAAYFHRGVALGYLGRKERCFLDFIQAHKLDSTLEAEIFIAQAYKSLRFKKLHP